jgi:hypothetical protein
MVLSGSSAMKMIGKTARAINGSTATSSRDGRASSDPAMNTMAGTEGLAHHRQSEDLEVGRAWHASMSTVDRASRSVIERWVRSALERDQLRSR